MVGFVRNLLLVVLWFLPCPAPGAGAVVVSDSAAKLPHPPTLGDLDIRPFVKGGLRGPVAWCRLYVDTCPSDEVAFTLMAIGANDRAG